VKRVEKAIAKRSTFGSGALDRVERAGEKSFEGARGCEQTRV